MKSKDILKVIKNFKKVLPMATNPYHLNMMEGEVNSNHECGTVHCHGGWYAIAACDLKQKMTFSTGADKMAKDLGFDDYDELLDWAEVNEGLWGNDVGSRMFISRWAFWDQDKRPTGAHTLQHIIDHWTEVYKRTKDREKSFAKQAK